MSTTTSLARALPLVVAGWLGVLVLVGLLTDVAPGYVVVLPKAGLLDDLPQESGVLSATRFSVTLANPGGGFARDLWRRGALLVLPAGLPGCLPLPDRHGVPVRMPASDR